MNPDFGRTADDYARHRAGFPDSLFKRLSELGIGLEGQDVVDLGTGTGTLGRGFARRGRIRASAGVDASLSPDRVAAFDAELAVLLSDAFPGERISIPHRIFAVVGRRPEA